LPPPLLSFIPSPLIPGTVSTGIIFAFTYMCAHFFCHIHPPIPFSAIPTPTNGANPHCWAGPVLPLCSLIL
jgi:hypothetical protein